MRRLAHGSRLMVAAMALASSFIGAHAFAAGAPTAAQCNAAYESAQLNRQSGKLITARNAATTCARASCPDVVQQDCATWAGEIEKQIPSVIVIARDETTGDEAGARVIVDGIERPEAASGRAFEIDPGTHALRIERAGNQPLEQSIAVAQGERDRVMRFVLHAATPAIAVSPPESQVTYVPAYVMAGSAVLAFGASAWLGISGRSDLSTLRSTCAPSCSDDRVDPVKRALLVSDLLLGIGVVWTGFAIYLAIRPPGSHATSERAVPTARIGIVPSRDGARLSVGATF